MRFGFACVVTVFASVVAIDVWAAQPEQRRPTLSLPGADVEITRCEDLRVTSSTGEIALGSDAMSRPAGTRAIAISLGPASGIQVRREERESFELLVCKAAVGANADQARAALSRVAVESSGGRLTATGPEDGNWLTFVILTAPRGSRLDLETMNGPIFLDGVQATVEARTLNGQVRLRQTEGAVTLTSSSGSLSYQGSGAADIDIASRNGAVSVELVEPWRGGRVKVSTDNGPLTLVAPASFQPGIEVRSSWRSEWSGTLLSAASLAAASRGERTLALGAGQPVISLRTNIGPVSVTRR